MGQTIIPDTNVLINNSKILDKENVVITYQVLHELDKLKNDKYIGYKVREVVREIIEKDIRCKDYKRVNKEVSTDDSLIKIGMNNDNVKVITEDCLMYKKGQARGIDIELYQPDLKTYSGVIKDKIDNNKIDEIYEKGKIKSNKEYYNNQFVDFGKVVTRYKNGYLYFVDWNRCVNGLDGNPTRRQLMALDVLFDKSIKLVSIFGEQGSGKTCLSLNSAIDQVKNGDYSKIYISRPKKTSDIDDGFGYLPGEIDQKYQPYTEPFKDNLYTQFSDMLEVVPLSSIQGRNLEDAIFIITEFQDIKPSDTKLIIGRSGNNCKMIIEGDIEQHADNTLNKYNNGLTHVVNTFKNSEITATIKLNKNKRSELSSLSNKL